MNLKNLAADCLIIMIIVTIPAFLKMSGINIRTNEIFEANFDILKPKTAFVFKTIVDPFLGRFSLIKVRSGVIKSDDLLYDSRTDREYKIGKLYILTGNKTAEVPELHAGDLGALAKISDLATSDTLSTKAVPIMYAKIDLPIPYTSLRWKAVHKSDVDKIAQSMAKLMAEDPTFKAVNDAENRAEVQGAPIHHGGHIAVPQGDTGNVACSEQRFRFRRYGEHCSRGGTGHLRQDRYCTEPARSGQFRVHLFRAQGRSEDCGGGIY